MKVIATCLALLLLMTWMMFLRDRANENHLAETAAKAHAARQAEAQTRKRIAESQYRTHVQNCEGPMPHFRRAALFLHRLQ